MTWQALHYISGLRRLGFDVWYVEDSDRPLINARSYLSSKRFKSNLSYLATYMSSIGLPDRWILREPGGTTCYGALDSSGLNRLYARADAAFNLCGAQEPRPEHDLLSRRVYIQTDPVSDQVRVANGDAAKADELRRYDYLFSYGENIGESDCLVPDDGNEWLPTRPPVCIDWWYAKGAVERKLTTIAKWHHAKKDVVWQEHSWHWSKDYEFRKYLGIADSAPIPLEIAVSSITEGEVEELHRLGWMTRPSATVKHPRDYRRYIQTSLGEFTVAKEQYVQPRSGWFSDRSVCYLAAGRPVITQETGFSKFVPAGEGLLAFTTPAEAAEAIEKVASDYERHARAAVEVARDSFAAEVVIESMVERMGL